MRRIIFALLIGVVMSGVAGATELSSTNDESHRYGWLFREQLCLHISREKCDEILRLQLNGAVGEAAATAAAAASSGGNSTSTGPR